MGKIVVSNLGKAYKQYPSRTSRLREWLTLGRRPQHKRHWVLNDISFEISPGEAVGIVGSNGTGKSTLLKMIAGTIQPTTGNVTITGTTSALLELGMGFHSDFTGRQNVYMAGQLLGLTSEEITELMPHIEEFAEIGEYIDQPVRVYSSGMQVRLAFSVATAKRPDLLIVDEALSVGDAYFQHKSFDRIRDFRKQGTTLLLVSHARETIQSICDRAIFLKDGHIEKIGNPEQVMDYYQAMLSKQEGYRIRQKTLSDGTVQTISGTGEASILSVELLDEENKLTDAISVGAKTKLRIKAKVNKDIPQLVLGFMFKDKLGQTIFGTNTFKMDSLLTNLSAGETVSYDFDFPMNLGPGSYSIATCLSLNDSHLDRSYEWRDYSFVFHVQNKEKTGFVGSAWLDTSLSISRG
jgi:lipopolysaccharide transport system ATP-binding protein